VRFGICTICAVSDTATVEELRNFQLQPVYRRHLADQLNATITDGSSSSTHLEPAMTKLKP